MHGDHKDPRADLFSHIRKTEQDVAHLLEKAEMEKENILQKARLDAAKTREEGIARVNDDSQQKIEKFRSQVYVLKDSKVAESKDEIKNLEKKAKKNKDKAVDFLYEKFLAYINA